MIFGHRENESICGRQGYFSGDAERGVRVDQGHQLNPTPFADLVHKRTETLSDGSPRIGVGSDRRRTAFQIHRLAQQFQRGVAAEQIDLREERRTKAREAVRLHCAAVEC